MYDTMLSTAAKIGATVASNPIGQMVLEYTEKCLWAVEKSVQWYMLPEQKDEDVASTEAKEPASSSSEKSEDTAKPESEERPLPWVLFLPLLVCLKAAKTSLDVCSYILSRQGLEASSIVEFIQTRRNMLKEIKDQTKSNQEEEEVKDEPSSDSTTATKNNDNPEVPVEIKVTQATPEKEIKAEDKTETETTTASPTETATSATASPTETATSATSSETATVVEPPSGTSSPVEESIESDNGNDSSSTLEPSEKEDTNEEDEDFHSVKSSSTYFSPDSSYSFQSASEESKTEIGKDTKELSIASAIEDLRSLSVTDEPSIQTPKSSLSSSTSSIKTEGSKKRTTFSSFFQVKRKTT